MNHACLASFKHPAVVNQICHLVLYAKTKYMETGRHRGVIPNEHIKIGSNSYEKVKTFKYLGSLLTNQNSIQEEIKCRLKAGNSCYYSVQTLSSRLIPKNLKK